MLYMIMIKASLASESHIKPEGNLMKQMDDYNDLLEAKGVKVLAKGLHPSSDAIRIHFDSKGNKTLDESKHPLTKDTLAGFFLIEVSSYEEARYYFELVPDPIGYGEGSIELRKVY